MELVILSIVAIIISIWTFKIISKYRKEQKDRCHIEQNIKNGGKITPICTNLRYDGTNRVLNFNIGEMRRLNLNGDLKVLSGNKIIHHKIFKKLYDIAQMVSVSYEPIKENEEIEAILTLNGESTSTKIILNAENTRNPITWQEWINKGK